jgi:nucleoside-diphosphate-sugar epimerase
LINVEGTVDYVIHGASITDPKNYQTNPIETITLNFFGTYNLLQFAKSKNAKFLLLSSTEVYGNLDHKSPIKETELGYINLQDPRSSYNEGKRSSESLCAAFHSQYNLDVLIARLSRTYGPTVKFSDTKAISQFIFASINNENIVLKSKGLQEYSFVHVADAIQGIFLLLKKGKSNEAYNITHPDRYKLHQIASIISLISGTKLIYDFKLEPKLSYSRTDFAIQNIDKIISLGFLPQYTTFLGLKSTIEILNSIKSKNKY